MGFDRNAGIEVENLVREFKKGPRAVDCIDLRVEPGEIYGFLGPNGAGKSTTVLVLTTLLHPTSGTAWVAGFDVVPGDEGLARRGAQQGGEDADRGRLAGAVGAEEAVDLPGGHAQVQAVDGTDGILEGPHEPAGFHGGDI